MRPRVRARVAIRKAWRDAGAAENTIDMDIFGRIPGHACAILSVGHENREFVIEADHGFDNGRIAADS